MNAIDFDHQSATRPLPEVVEAMLPYLAGHYGSAAALHREGLWARDALDQARQRAAAFVGADSAEEILFTSDGAEAANLAIKGLAWANERYGNHLVLSEVEPQATMQSVDFLLARGWTCAKVKVDRQGRIDPEAIRAALTDRTVLICSHAANPDLGTLQPIQAMGAIALERGIPLFVDANAAAGWLPLEAPAWGASLLSFSADRLHGPKGAGILYRHRQVRLASLIHGGAQEGGRRAGTENIPSIAGAGLACEIAGRERERRVAHVAALQQRLWSGLSQAVPALHLHGPPVGPGRLCNHLNFSVPGADGEAVLLRCDVKGLALASGSSCLGRSLRVPPALAAIGVTPELARSNLLMTLGHDNTLAEVEEALRLFPEVVATLRAMSPAWKPAG